MYPRSAIKTYKGSGVNPVGAEQPLIYKDPPKAIFTRKYEPVNEFEIQTFIRPDSEYADPSRVNESIQYFARGQNPMVEVSYSNAGGAQTNQSLGNFQASNPYKIEVVRPPMYPIETLVPLSAPRIHQNYSIQTNANIAPISIAGFYDKNLVRNATNTLTSQGMVRVNPSLEYLDLIGQEGRDSIHTNYGIMDTLKGSIRPTTVLSIDPTREANTLRKTAVRDQVINLAVNTANTFSNIVVFDPKLNTSIDVGATIREKKYIAVSAAAGLPIIFNTSDGKEIKLKDYTYSIVQPNMNNTQLVIQVNQPEVKLERNMPLFAANTNLQIGDSNKGVDNMREGFTNVDLDDILVTPASTNINMLGYNGNINRDQLDTIHLDLKTPATSASANPTLKGYDEWGARGNQNTIQLNKLSVFGDTADRNFGNSMFSNRMEVPMGSSIRNNTNVNKLSNSFKQSHYDRRPTEEIY